MNLDFLKILTIIPAAVQSVEAIKGVFTNKETRSQDKLSAARDIVVAGLNMANVEQSPEITAALDAAINAEVAAMKAKDSFLALVASFKK